MEKNIRIIMALSLDFFNVYNFYFGIISLEPAQEKLPVREFQTSERRAKAHISKIQRRRRANWPRNYHWMNNLYKNICEIIIEPE